MQQGYVRLYRCMVDKPWSRHPDYVAVWVYCLLRANYKETDVMTRYGTLVHLKPGQFITSRQQISLNTGVEENKVERVLKTFKIEQQIEQQNCGKFRIISIVNWSKYQANEQEFEQQMNNRRTTDEQQMNTDKKLKKEKKDKERSIGMFPICEAWKAYIEMRVKIKKPMTENAKTLAVLKLEALRKLGNDPVQVLEQSIFNSWQGLFEIKGEGNGTRTTPTPPAATFSPVSPEESQRLRKVLDEYPG